LKVEVSQDSLKKNEETKMKNRRKSSRETRSRMSAWEWATQKV